MKYLDSAPHTIHYSNDVTAVHESSHQSRSRLLKLAACAVLAPLGATAAITPSGVVTPSSGDSFWSNGGNASTEVLIGGGSAGSLVIDGGSDFASDSSSLYDDASVTVAGAGSSWGMSDFYLGYDGTATFDVENGATVTTGVGYLGSGSGSGTLNLAGADSTWTASDTSYVGYNDAQGTLNISDGASANTKALTIGYYNAQGTIFVTGSGSSLNVDGDMSFGGYTSAATGSLTIDNGATAETEGLYLGSEANTEGLLSVSGAGSKLTATYAMELGGFGTGDLGILEGGEVDASGANVTVGYASAAEGNALVAGAGSIWSTNNMTVGSGGTGSVKIVEGGKVNSSGSGIVGYSGQGTVLVRDAGSEWNMTANLSLGEYGDGQLSILDGGQVDTGSGHVYVYAGGELNLGLSNGGDPLLSTSAAVENRGTIQVFALGGLDAGTYTPISATSVSQFEAGMVRTYGGSWDNSAMEFTAAATEVYIDAFYLEDLSSKRIISGSGDWVAAFANDAGVGEFSVINAVATPPGGSYEFIRAYQIGFSSDGESSLLFSFNVGSYSDFENLELWQLLEGSWSRLDDLELMSYSDGFYNMLISDGGLYAIAGNNVIPEFSSSALLGGLIALGFVGTRRRRRLPPHSICREPQ